MENIHWGKKEHVERVTTITFNLIKLNEIRESSKKSRSESSLLETRIVSSTFCTNLGSSWRKIPKLFSVLNSCNKVHILDNNRKTKLLLSSKVLNIEIDWIDRFFFNDLKRGKSLSYLKDARTRKMVKMMIFEDSVYFWRLERFFVKHTNKSLCVLLYYKDFPFLLFYLWRKFYLSSTVKFL